MNTADGSFKAAEPYRAKYNDAGANEQSKAMNSLFGQPRMQCQTKSRARSGATKASKTLQSQIWLNVSKRVALCVDSRINYGGPRVAYGSIVCRSFCSAFEVIRRTGCRNDLSGFISQLRRRNAGTLKFGEKLVVGHS